jgi:hypothetical protein
VLATWTRRFRDLFAGSDLLPLVLIAGVWAVLLLWPPGAARQGDVLRFTEIAHGGTPYVDQQVEYPPLETLLVLVVGATSLTKTVLMVAFVNAISTIACWVLIRSHWSPETGRLFLWFTLPLQVFMPFRLDAVPVALALGGIVLADRDRKTLSGLAFATAILFKVWPLVLLPILLIRGRMRALIATLATVIVGGLLWVAVSGFDAIRQVESFRGATGWHIESVFGVIDSLVTDAPLRVEAGATRIGHIEGWETVALRGVTICAIAIAWLLARRRAVDSAGGPALAALASLLLLSPLASPQYVAWLLPWAAIVASERRRIDVRVFTLGAAVAASFVFAVYWGNPYALRLLLVLAGVRALCIAGLAYIGFTHRSVDRRGAAAKQPTLVLQPATNLPDG